MRLLLDECVTRRVKPDFVGHEMFTVEEAGLKGLKNGELLHAMSGRFDALITVDRNLPFQQNLSSIDFAIIILVTKRNRREELSALVPQALLALRTIRPGDVIRLP
jgi:hypothetical protein